jgi:hypothetical protein
MPRPTNRRMRITRLPERKGRVRSLLEAANAAVTRNRTGDGIRKKAYAYHSSSRPLGRNALTPMRNPAKVTDVCRILPKSVKDYPRDMPYFLSSWSRRLSSGSSVEAPEAGSTNAAFTSAGAGLAGRFWAIILASFLAATRLGLRNANIAGE